MINLIRKKDKRWILQKNISSSDKIIQFLKASQRLNNHGDRAQLLSELRRQNQYIGRSLTGSANTMGVRSSQIKFYMFGYSLKNDRFPENSFFRTKMSDVIIGTEDRSKIANMALVNLFSIQFPHPFSDTSPDFCVNAGRLIIKLLLDERIDCKLYIDEFCYFLPFIKSINKSSYKELINSIKEFRQLSYEQKKKLFETVQNYDDVFSNVFHEVNYYFCRIFQGFQVFDIVADEEHNSGQLFSFKHGQTDTRRNDAFKPRARCSGYIKLSDIVIENAKKLNNKFDVCDKPATLTASISGGVEDFIRQVYELKPMEYIATINQNYCSYNNISQVINKMIEDSKYGSADGKDFEKSLKTVFEQFDRVESTETIGGKGDTDILCVLSGDNDTHYRINVDAKTSKHGISVLTPTRLNNHLILHQSKYCIVVSSRFALGASQDLTNYPIVAIKSEVLADYCLKEFSKSKDGFINYDNLENIIKQNMGRDISVQVTEYIEKNYLYSNGN